MANFIPPYLLDPPPPPKVTSPKEYEDPAEAYLSLHLRVLSRKLSCAEEDKILQEMVSIWARLGFAQKRLVGENICGMNWLKETMDGNLAPLNQSIWERLASGKRY